MTRIRDRIVVGLAAGMALAATLSLAGCGRKGLLDPPPSAAASAPIEDRSTLGESNDPNAPGFRRPPPASATAQPLPPPPMDKRTFILDPLIR